MKSNCYHCGLNNPTSTNFQCRILNQERQFCCTGCLAIAETLVENNLTDFYKFRSGSSTKPEELIPKEIQAIESLDNPSILNKISTNNDTTRTIELGLEGITCAACGWLIEKKLNALPAVKSINVNVSTQRVSLTWLKKESLSHILKTLILLGYKAYPFSEDAREKSFERANRSYIKRLLLAALGMMQVMSYALALYIGEFQDMSKEHQYFLYWISGIIATPVVFYSAKPFFISAWRNLQAKQLGMNLPVSIAILSAYFASVYSLFFNGTIYYFDSVVMFTFFLLIGRFLEHRARYRSLLKQQNFQKLVPLSVYKRHHDQSITSVEVSEIKVGDILVIHAGSVIPVDGTLLENTSEINESIITGEFMPVYKNIGDTLISGSTNHSSSLVMQVSKEFEDSHIQQLIHLQQNAETMKPDSISLADQIAHWYVLIIFMLVIIAGFYWWQIQPELTFSIILSILVVSCPCALSLATPATIAAATSQLSDLGLMIRSKTALSRLAKVEHVYFDKTGTLTTGSIQLNKVICHSELSKEVCLQLAFQLEKISNHPIANAFKLHDNKHFKTAHLKETIGQGVSGYIDDQFYQLGHYEFILNGQNKIININNAHSQSTTLYLVSRTHHLATFILQDHIKETAINAVQALSSASYINHILSGDSQESVNNVASQLKIKHCIYNATPQKKLSTINRLQQTGKYALMVGDGFNDVGALAAAHVSITMATGSHLSKTASDAVLVSNDLSVIPKSLLIAKKVELIIKQNLTWAVMYNITAIPFAIMGLVPAWLAAIGMSLSSLIVVLNALRLRK